MYINIIVLKVVEIVEGNVSFQRSKVRFKSTLRYP